MDTIDPSNLNRQFLFRATDINQPKATVGAAFVNKRVGGAEVTGHHCKIQDKGPDFYKQFNIVICGVDNVAARRWMNAYLHSLLVYESPGDEEMEGNDAEPLVDPGSVIFLVDSGTEGFKGNVRVITPGISSCIDCFTKDHQILTSAGFKGLKELSELWDSSIQRFKNGLQIATYDQQSQGLVYQDAVAFILKGSANQKVARFKDDRVDLTVTLGHNMFVSCNYQSSWSKQKANRLVLEGASCRMKLVAEQGVMRRRETLSIFSGLDLMQQQALTHIYGMFLTCGSLVPDTSIVKFPFHLHSEMVRLLGELTWGWSSLHCGEFCCSELAQFLQACVINGGWLQDWTWSLCSQLLRSLLQGLVCGGNGDLIEVPSVAVMDDFVRLATECGVATTCRMTEKSSWIVELNENNLSSSFSSSNGSLQIEDYHGPTWCVTVPNGLIFARRAKLDESTGLLCDISSVAITGNCNIELFPPEVKIPLCTIAATPRDVAHCIQYAALIAWNEKVPFADSDGQAVKYDTDNPDHMRWIMQVAQTRATEFHVTKGGPLDMQKTMGVVKNIIPAIASTNALIAAAAANEALKIATSAAPVLDNYILYNSEEGSFLSTQSFSKNPLCEVCGNPPRVLQLEKQMTLRDVLNKLMATPQFALQNPRLLTEDSVLWMKAGQAQLRQFYEANLERPATDFLKPGDALTVSDDALPNSSLTFTIQFS